MKVVVVVFALTLQLAGAVSALAEGANCGNPCDDGYVWTDKNGGKCIPEPKPTS